LLQHEAHVIDLGDLHAVAVLVRPEEEKRVGFGVPEGDTLGLPSFPKAHGGQHGPQLAVGNPAGHFTGLPLQIQCVADACPAELTDGAAVQGLR
jgi:hypothetical protein